MKRSKTAILTTFILLSSIMTVKAEDYKLHIDLKEGDPIEISLNTKPILSFADQKLYVSGETLLCEISGIEKWYYLEDSPIVPTSVNSLKVVESVSYRNNVFTVTSISSDNVKVFDIQGIERFPDINVNEKTVVIDFNNLPNDVYIIKIGAQSYKINKK